MKHMNPINRFFDTLARPEIKVFSHSRSAFKVCGFSGLILAILLGFGLTFFRGLSPWVMLGLIGVAMLTFLALAMFMKIISGEEQLIYYHHEIAIMVMAALFLKLLNYPLLPYLDIVILGIGTFLFCGRIGCLMVGCCHGNPNRLGVCYSHDHVEAGFTSYYEGIRLFPIQMVESLFVLLVVITGLLWLLIDAVPGQVMAWYIVAYDIGRFVFEFFRGDADRPYYLGFSEAQWISVFLMIAIVAAEYKGWLIFHLWHVIAAAVMVVSMVLVSIYRLFNGTIHHKLFNPRHVREVAHAVTMAKNDEPLPGKVTITSTSLGFHISSGQVQEDGSDLCHYTFSLQDRTMDQQTADSLARLILRLKQHTGAKELLNRTPGVFHLILHPAENGGSA